MLENKKPVILIFSTAYLPIASGAELAVKEITDRINEYDFFVITARMRKNLPARERIGNTEIFRVGFGYSFLDKLLSPFWGAFTARKMLKKHNVKLFWSIMVTFTSGAPFLLRLLPTGLDPGGTRTPILLTLQEGDSEAHLKFSNFGLTGLAWFFAMRMTDRVQTISAYLKDFAIRMGAKCEIDVVPNGIDSVKSQKLEVKSPNQNSKIIITTSRLVRKNGIDVLIKAMAEVVKNIPGIKLWILGSGEEEAVLRALAGELYLNKNVEFFGEIENEKIYEYLHKADVFARPSRSEGLGTSFLEAMASGLPIIGTSVGGIPDFLRDGETGLFCKVDDPRDLADKILLLLKDVSLRQKISSQGRKLALQSYSWESVAGQMKEIFDKIKA